MLLHSHSSMSSLSLASPRFINDKACLCALPLCCCLNVRNNLSDTTTMLVMIDMMFKSMNVLCVTKHIRPQVDVLTFTFLVLTSFLCSTGIAALQHRKHFRFLHLLLSASSGVSLSLLSLYCSLLLQIRFSYIHGFTKLPATLNRYCSPLRSK